MYYKYINITKLSVIMDQILLTVQRLKVYTNDYYMYMYNKKFIRNKAYPKYIQHNYNSEANNYESLLLARIKWLK